MIVRKEHGKAWTEPTQHTIYNANDRIGAGVVVYRGTNLTHVNNYLSPYTTYDYKFYSENSGVYSVGVTAQATTMPEPGVVVVAGVVVLALLRRSARGAQVSGCSADGAYRSTQ